VRPFFGTFTYVKDPLGKTVTSPFRCSGSLGSSRCPCQFGDTLPLFAASVVAEITIKANPDGLKTDMGVLEHSLASSRTETLPFFGASNN
jgi:hypothetical protein